MCGDLHSVFVTDIVVAEAMVEMEMCIDNLSQRQVLVFYIFVEFFALAAVDHARIYRNCLSCFTVGNYKGAYCEGVEAKLFDIDHSGTYIISFVSKHASLKKSVTGISITARSPAAAISSFRSPPLRQTSPGE